MKKLHRRVAASAAALLLFAGLLRPAMAADTTGQQLQENLNAASEAYEQAAEEQEALENQVNETEEQIGSLEGRADEIAAQLQSVYSLLQQAQTELDAATGEAEAAAAALTAKQAEYDAQLDQAREQLLAMQKLQNSGSIALLSQATNLFQLLTYAHALDDIAAHNTALLEQLDAEAQALSARRQEAEAAAARAEEARNALQTQQQALDATRSELANALQQANANLTQQQAEAEAAAQITEERRRAYQQATAELDRYARAQNEKYTAPDLYCSLDFGSALAPGASISCNYGDPDGIDGSHHNGTDFPAAGGTPIYAVADGVVSAARAMNSYGNCVQISHGTADDGNNYASLYAHMASIAVSEGQTVTKGQVIGYVGNTGDVVGANGGYHLHLELRINGSRTDAMRYIPH